MPALKFQLVKHLICSRLDNWMITRCLFLSLGHKLLKVRQGVFTMSSKRKETQIKIDSYYPWQTFRFQKPLILMQRSKVRQSQAELIVA